MKTPLLAALGLALIALAAALYLFSGTKAQEPASSAAQSAARESTTSALDTARESVTVEPAAAAEEVQRTNIAARSSEAAAGSECVVRVVDAARQPLEGVALFALSAEKQLQNAKSDADGRARFSATGAVQLFAIADERPVQRFELELAAVGHELVLDAPSASVAGVVTVGGAPPSEPVRFWLQAGAVPFDSVEHPKELRDALTRTAHRTTQSNGEGAFEFSGLALEWKGALGVYEGHKLQLHDGDESPWSKLVLESPRSDLRLEVERMTRVVGRFENAAGEGVRTSEKTTATIVSLKEGSRTSSSSAVDERGGFAHVVFSADFDSVELLLECDQGRAARTLQRHELTPTPAGDLDVGVIVLAPNGNLRLRARSAGTPVAQAKALVKGELRWSEGDAEGRIDVLSTATGAATVRVIAPDFWALEVPVVLPTQDELVVEMAPANVLTIKASDVDGAPLAGANVWFEATGAGLFAESNGMDAGPQSIGISRGKMTSLTSKVSDSGVFEGRIKVTADSEGVVRLQELNARCALRVSLVDSVGSATVSQTIETLGASEKRTVELRHPVAFKSLHGHVRDPAGNSVVGAHVTIQVGGHRTHASTGQLGDFILESLAASELELKVQSPQFAPLIVPRVMLVDPKTELQLTLEHGRTVVAEVVDESGASQSDARVVAHTTDDRHEWTATAQAPGRYEFRPLQVAPLRITAHLHGRRFERELGASEEHVRIVVPTPGQLTAELAHSVDVAKRAPCVRLRSIDDVVNISHCFSAESPRGPLSLGPLTPGDYELIRAFIGAPELGDAPGWHEVGPPVRVTIRAGETTQVELP